jgi:Uncharacterized protein conserved in bacteria
MLGRVWLIVVRPSFRPLASKRDGLKSSFRLTTWNINKFQRANWQQELKTSAQQSDLLLLQEAVERPVLSQLLLQAHFNWQQIQAFRLEGEAIGVLNAAPVAALYNCSLRELEPVSRLPKVGLIDAVSSGGQ